MKLQIFATIELLFIFLDINLALLVDLKLSRPQSLSRWWGERKTRKKSLLHAATYHSHWFI
jgi:hypothetical protein